MDEAAARHGVEVQVSTREAQAKGFQPLARRGDVRHALDARSPPDPPLGASPAAAEVSIRIANCHRLMQAYP
ncbi:hypothetical protein MPEAHAMD_7260 [Methylobacterium frigidaeris]|uniref:Uncharacterized protein n=1 Tax=Methylobacterium frigidaeris TaxID=2038277 RepID=A0AA37HK96_9HYPH|nr:hypothetical protein MPEAHAMD_7260 [Methylobacterium frigidaeris]